MRKKQRFHFIYWLLPLILLITPTRKTFSDGDDDVASLPKTLSSKGVPYNRQGRFRSPFANPNFGTPCKVRVGFLLKSITNYNIKAGSFEADFYLTYMSDKPMPGNIVPHFTNGFLQDDDHKNQIANEPTFKMWKYHAVFYSTPDLREYPFDLQELEIGIEEDDVGIDQIQFIADRENTNLDSDFLMPGWEVLYQESRTLTHYYPDRFEFDDLYYPRYVFRLGIQRYATNAFFTVYVPAFIIVLVSLSGVLLKKEEVDTRINSSAPMLAAAVLFHFTLSQEIPATAYLTKADKLMLGVYLGLIVNMFATWAFFLFDEKHSDVIYYLGKRLVPPINLILYILGCIL
jgi:hypothetical protein